MSKTVNATVASTSSIPSAFHSHSHSDLTSSYSDNNYQRNIAMESNKRSKLLRPFLINPELASITIIAQSSKVCKPLFAHLFF